MLVTVAPDGEHHLLEAAVRQELCALLKERTDAYNSGADAWTVVDNTAEHAATQLRQLVPADRASVDDLPAVMTLALFHWARYTALPEGRDLEDWAWAYHYFLAILELDPDKLVGETRGFVENLQLQSMMKVSQLSNSGLELLERYEASDLPEDLDRAVQLLDLARITCRKNDHFYPYALANLGTALHRRYARRHQLQDLSAAIELTRQAVDSMSPDRSPQPAMVSALGRLLTARFEATGDVTDLTQAIALLKRAAYQLPAEPARRRAVLETLLTCLQLCTDATGERATMDDLATVLRTLIGQYPADPEVPGWRRRLQSVVMRLDGDTGPTAADSAHDPGSVELGRSLLDRYRRHGQPADLDQAIDMLARAAGSAGAGADRIDIAAELAAALLHRFRRGAASDDLDRAIRVLTEVLHEGSPAPQTRASLAAELGTALVSRYQRANSVADLNIAIAALRAYGFSATEPALIGRCLATLGLALYVRSHHGRTLAEQDLIEAGTAFVRAIELTAVSEGQRGTFLTCLTLLAVEHDLHGLALAEEGDVPESRQPPDSAPENPPFDIAFDVWKRCTAAERS